MECMKHLVAATYRKGWRPLFLYNHSCNISEQGKCSGEANALVEIMDMPFAKAQLKDQL